MARRVPPGIFTVPASWKWPEGVVAGVSVGRCIVTGKLLHSRQHAHAHTHTCRESDCKGTPFRGWICTKSTYVYANPDRLSGPPNKTMLHELAHIMVGAGHTYEWADTMIRLGVTPEQDWKLAKVIRVRAAAKARKLARV